MIYLLLSYVSHLAGRVKCSRISTSVSVPSVAFPMTRAKVATRPVSFFSLLIILHGLFAILKKHQQQTAKNMLLQCVQNVCRNRRSSAACGIIFTDLLCVLQRTIEFSNQFMIVTYSFRIYVSSSRDLALSENSHKSHK